MAHYIPMIMVSLIFIAIIAAIFFSWFFYAKARNKERMYLLEKGENLELILDDKAFQSSFPWLKVGVIVIGISMGFGVVTLVEFLGPPRPGISRIRVASSETFYMFILGLFSGVSFIIVQYIDKRHKQK